MEQHQEFLSKYIKDIQISGKLNRMVYQRGKQLFELGHCHLLSSSTDEYKYLIKDDYQDFQSKIIFNKQKIKLHCSCKSTAVCSHAFAALNQALQDMSRSAQVSKEGAVKYSREGMIKRVLAEREIRAKQENYSIDFSDNIYGEHRLFNEQGKVYNISFYHFKNRQGYCSCPDYQTNKLETCKHLMFAFNEFEKQFDGLSLPKQSYPFLEIIRHPLFDYQISWFYPHTPPKEVQGILSDFFDEQQLYKPQEKQNLHLFIEQIQQFKSVKIRPEVKIYIDDYFEEKSLLDQFKGKTFKADLLNKSIYPFQQEGIEFLSSKRGSILADEIGLGKTVQALGAALHKIEILGFEKVKIVCPKQLTDHWETELKKWIPPIFLSHFETESFNEINPLQAVDLLIIDEAQKISDYDSRLLQELQQINYHHILLITDSKLENSLMKFHAISGLISQYLLTPLWELTYKHCLYNPIDLEETVAYYNLDHLHNLLKNIYLRREKSDITEQLPEVDQVLIPVVLDDEQKKEQSNWSKELIALQEKKRISSYDILKSKNILKQLLHLGQYTTLVSPQKKGSPKLKEFQHFINHKLDLKPGESVIIFAQNTLVQQQLKSLLQNERKSVQILSENHKDFPKNLHYFITTEVLQKELPLAHHYIYFHLPNDTSFINQRKKMLEESRSGIQQSRIYLFETAYSLESVFNRWTDSKPYLLTQLIDFLSGDKHVKKLGLRLQEELGHVLKSFIQPDIPTKGDSEQMDLFGELVQPKLQTSKSIEGDQELTAFFKVLMKSFLSYEKLSNGQREAFTKGQFKLSEENGDVVIRLKKNEAPS